MDKNAELAS